MNGPRRHRLTPGDQIGTILSVIKCNWDVIMVAIVRGIQLPSVHKPPLPPPRFPAASTMIRGSSPHLTGYERRSPWSPAATAHDKGRPPPGECHDNDALSVYTRYQDKGSRLHVDMDHDDWDTYTQVSFQRDLLEPCNPTNNFSRGPNVFFY